jgi:hypothetical protein
MIASSPDQIWQPTWSRSSSHTIAVSARAPPTSTQELRLGAEERRGGPLLEGFRLESCPLAEIQEGSEGFLAFWVTHGAPLRARLGLPEGDPKAAPTARYPVVPARSSVKNRTRHGRAPRVIGQGESLPTAAVALPHRCPLARVELAGFGEDSRDNSPQQEVEEMVRKLLAGVGLAATLVLASAVPASASGPAAPGKVIITADCEGLGTVTVSVQRGENSNGAAQIVGQRGQGIPVSFTFSAVDLTTNETLFTESDAVGHGNAHPNQQTTTCTFVIFQGPASEFFTSSELMQLGIDPTDTVLVTGTVVVILKL